MRPWSAAARHPIAALALVAVVTAVAVFGTLRIEPQVDFVDAVPQQDGLDLYRDLLDRLDGVRFVAVYMPYDPQSGLDDLRSDEGFDALVAEQQDLTAYLQDRFPGTFSHFLSAYEAMRAGNHMTLKIATAGNPPPGSYALPHDPATWQVVRDQTLNDASIDDVLAPDGSSALLLAFFATHDNQEARHATQDVADALPAWQRDRPREGRVTGDPEPTGLLWASAYTDARNQSDLAFWSPVAAGVVALALLWVVRRPTNVLVAVTSLAVAGAWTFGLMGLLGIRVSFLTVFLAPLVLGVGVDYAVHILHRYEEERRRGATQRSALETATSRTGGAVALAAATTMLGIGVVAFVPNRLFAQIGAVGALGIGLGFLASLVVAPALRAVLPDRHRIHARNARGSHVHQGTGRDRVGPWVARIGTWTRCHAGGVSLVVLLLSLAAAAAVVTATDVESGGSENEFPQDDPVIALQHRIEEEYGAFERGYLIVSGDIARAAALQALDEAGRHALDLPLARNASSVADLVRADRATDDGAVDILESALLSQGPEGTMLTTDQGLPQTDKEARDALDALYDDPLWRTLAPFTITRDYDLAVVAVQLDPWQDQRELRALRDAMQDQAAALQERLGPEYRVAAGGAPVNRAAVVEQTPWNVALSAAGSAVLVATTLAVAWRRRGPEGFKVALLGGVLVLTAALWLVATVPLLDAWYRFAHTTFGAAANTASLTDMFLLAFAITVAVGIDDLVHVAHRYWEARDDGADRDTAAQWALRNAGRAITGTSVTTFAAFAVLAGIYFLQSKNLAILTAAGVLYAYVLTLAIGPRILAGKPTGSDRT